MVLSGEPLSGFGFLRSASPGAASRRGDSQSAADSAGLRRIAPPGAAPGRRTAVFSRSLLYRVKQPATILSSGQPFVRPAFRPPGLSSNRPFIRSAILSDDPPTPTRSSAFVKTCLEWYRQ